MMLDDAVDEHLISVSPVHRHRRRGRRRDHAPTRNERVWAMPEHVLRIADQARTLGGPSASLLIITAAWTGCRWGELTGLQRHHVNLHRRTITIDPNTGALHESKHQLWLGPPKTPASARTITLPRFLVGLIQMHLSTTNSDFVFTSPQATRYDAATSTVASSAPPSTATPEKEHNRSGQDSPSTASATATKPGSSRITADSH